MGYKRSQSFRLRDRARVLELPDDQHTHPWPLTRKGRPDGARVCPYLRLPSPQALAVCSTPHDATIGPHRVICADANDLLPTLAGIDVVISDPPFSARTHDGARTLAHDGPLVNFAPLGRDPWLALAAQLCDVAKRWVILSVDVRYMAAVQDFEFFVRHGIWVKPNGAPQFSGDRPGMGWEAVAILHRPGRKQWCGGGGHAVWIVPKVQGDAPTEKPVRLLKAWLDDFTQPGEVILDPFMGSGSTGVACIEMNRTFVGIERNHDLWDKARARILHAYGQMDLFPRARNRRRARARSNHSHLRGKDQLILF